MFAFYEIVGNEIAKTVLMSLDLSGYMTGDAKYELHSYDELDDAQKALYFDSVQGACGCFIQLQQDVESLSRLGAIMAHLYARANNYDCIFRDQIKNESTLGTLEDIGEPGLDDKQEQGFDDINTIPFDDDYNTSTTTRAIANH